MKKSTYAVCGSLMLIVASLTRTFGDAGPELLMLVIVGLVTLIGSADLPQQQKGRVR